MDKLSYIIRELGDILIEEDYKNEYETIRRFHTLPGSRIKRFKELVQNVIDTIEPHETEDIAVRARHLREEGNLIFRKATGDKVECTLSAIRVYTHAILEAENNFDELCLCYANRGMALQEYGYYKQAYDDCIMALEFGYPEKLKHKLIMRQAFCAWKLSNVEQLTEHIECLQGMQLNANFTEQLEALQDELQLLNNRPPQQPTEQRKNNWANSNMQEIVTTATSRGRYMIATQRISQGKVIFMEHGDCFVPINSVRICQQCAATQLIPIPCPQCHKRVVYCSRQCRELDAPIHSYECAAYRRNLLSMVGVSHLAMRVVLTYLPLMLPHLRTKTNAQQLWQTLLSLANVETNDEESATQIFRPTLCMITHLDKISVLKRVFHAVCAYLLQRYLNKCSSFFEQFKKTAASSEDWSIFVGAFILRTAGQLLANGHVSDAIMPTDSGPVSFTLLHAALWKSPYHVKLGCLHKFDNIKLITAVNYPYLSLCNHACSPCIRTKFDGRNLTVYATRNIEVHEEIFNCYTGDYKRTAQQQREKQLQDIFKFTCCCRKCMRLNPDQDYLKFYRYRCEKRDCRKSFVPHLTEVNLNWWLSVAAHDEPSTPRCTACSSLQTAKWYKDISHLSFSCYNLKSFRELYKSFKELDNWLLDYHRLKLHIARDIIEKSFELLETNCSFEGIDYASMNDIIKFRLAGTTALYGNVSVEYITALTCLWDMIALRKYKCGTIEMKKMLDTLEYTADELKLVFVNYYNDFIEQHCTNN